MVVGVFSALGLAFLLSPRWLLPLTAAFLLLGLAILGRDARRMRWWTPFALASAGVAGILVGKFALDSAPVLFGSMAVYLLASLLSILPTVFGRGGRMSAKKLFEVFSAGCPACSEVIDKVKEAACPSCEVRVLDMNDPAVAEKARSLGIRSVPSVVVDGRLADCCAGSGIDLERLKELGLGRP